MEEWSFDGHTIVIGGLVALSVLSVFVVPACYVKQWLYDGYTVVKQWSYDGHTIFACGLGFGTWNLNIRTWNL